MHPKGWCKTTTRPSQTGTSSNEATEPAKRLRRWPHMQTAEDREVGNTQMHQQDAEAPGIEQGQIAIPTAASGVRPYDY